MTADRRLERLGELARAGVDADATSEHDALERARFVRAAVAVRGAPRRWRQLGLVAAATVAAAIAVVALPASPLQYRVEGALVTEAGYVRPAAGSAAAVRFSDGTSLTLRSGGAVRVGEVSARGARLSLEEGALDLSVVPRPRSRWRVDAGPYAVDV